MTVTRGASASLSAIARSHPAVLGGLLLLVAANALLPLAYRSHPVVAPLDYLGVLVLAFWTAALACRRSRREGPPAFRLLGLGAALGGLHYVPAMIRLPHPSLASAAISLAALVALAAGFMRWPQQVRMPRDRMRTNLDGLSIALSMFTVAWMALASTAGVGAVPRGMMLVYAVQISACLGILALWLLQETRLRLPAQAQAKVFVRSALVALVAHSTLTALLRATGHYTPGYLGHAVEVLHQGAVLCIALAALSPASADEAQPAVPRPSPVRALIPSLAALAVLLLAAVRIARPHGQPPDTLLVLCGLLLGILMLRHGLLILDLEHLSDDLEARVAARTRELEAHHHEAMGDLRMRMMAGLAAGLAHDLNNLLGVIRLRVELLLEGCPPRQEADLKVLSEASERAAVMTRRILASSRMQEIHPAAFDFTQWLGARGPLLQALLHPAQRLDLEVGGGMQVLADPQSLDQILQNLASNARDAMGPTGLLRIRAHGHGEGIRLEIRDDGPGIDPEHLSRMFEPFFTTKSNGTGLGLATVRNLVVQNRGTIHIDSRPGLGTAFLIDLPAPEQLLLA